MFKARNFIAGEFADSFENSWIEIENSMTGEKETQVADSGLMDVVKALQASNKAFTTWSKEPVEKRISALDSIAQALLKAHDELSSFEAEETGQAIRFTKSSVPRAVELLQYHASLLRTSQSQNVIVNDRIIQSHRLPLGVVGVILPWTDPVYALISRLAPALACGNVVIAKTSEFCARTNHRLAEVIHSAGLPPGVFALLQGRGEEVGRALVSHPGIHTIAFQGSTEVGREVLRESSENFKRTHLALGARNAVVVFNDIDLAKTMPSIVATCLGYNMASCLRGSRLFVQEKIYKPFMESFKAELLKVRLGDPKLESTDLGPLPSSAKKKHFDDVVSKAVSERGKLLIAREELAAETQALLERGNFVSPTVIFDLTFCSTLQQEDVEGPLISLSSFKYQNDAVKQANTSPFAQAAYVFEPDGAKAMRVATKLEAGRIFVNPRPQTDRALPSDPRMEFGGLKTSGLSREGGENLMRFFSQETAIGVEITP